MLPRDLRYSRRRFLASAAALTVGAGATPASEPVASERRPTIAVLGTVYRPLSYLYHLAGRFVHGVAREGGHWRPKHSIQSIWVEQSPENDLSKSICNRLGIHRARTVQEALLRNGKLAVDGVLIVAEHGNYPRNDRGQVLYPRAAMFRQVAEAFEKAGTPAPVFVARQLSHDIVQALVMVETAGRLGIPLMAGSPFSTIETNPRRTEMPSAPVSDVLVAGCGPLETFAFDAAAFILSIHAQCRERWSPIQSVRCLVGNEVWRAGDRGEWPRDLLHAALSHAESLNLGDMRDNVGSIAMPGMPATPPMAIQLEFGSGARGVGLLLNGHVQESVAAIRFHNSDQFSCRIGAGPAPGTHHFDQHAAEIDEFFATRKPARPVGEVLVCTAILERVMQSHAEGGRLLATPELAAF